MMLGTHNRVLKNDMWQWCFGSVIEPMLIVIVIVGISKLLAPHFITGLVIVVWLFSTATLSTVAVVLSSARTRGLAFLVLSALRNYITWAASRLRAV
jgi:hypothetical protein